jgi:preprotein translocase subunit SecF
MKAAPFNIDWMGKRKLFAGLSIAFVIISLFDIFWNGLTLGLDFTGGTLVEVKFPEPVQPEAVRVVLERSGYQNGVVQLFGTDRDVLVRMPPQAEGDQARLGDQIVEVLRDNFGEVTLEQANFVGPVVGEELRDDALLAVLAALGVVMVYVLFRFTRQFAIASVVALIHDVLVVLGFFALFHWTFDLSVLAAVLAVVGYSINDSIVVADRIRENFRLMRRATPIEVVNASLNQVLTRSLITSGTTLLTLVALLIAGGEVIRGFALALTIGILFGTYSSIFVVASAVVFMKMTREDIVPPVEEENKPIEEGPV